MSEVTEPEVNVRTCSNCSKVLPDGKRNSAKFCGNSCRTMNCRKKKAMLPMPKVYPMPMPMPAAQIHEAEQQRIAEAYALIERTERQAEERKRACWEEISLVAQKHGFLITGNHKPVEVFINLLPIQQGA